MMPSRETDDRSAIWALAGCAIALLYYLQLFDGGWIPHDEGTIGQSAWRILQGEVPHRDFDAMYTGLLEYMHAGAMRVMGVTLLTPRLVMLAAVVVWVTTIWTLARRLVGSPAAAFGVTVLAMLLGPANYPAAMPSWYNLFLATWGLWALVRWTEKEHWGWLVLAGVCGGLSILFKIAGLYFVAGTLFFVLHMAAAKPPLAGKRPTRSFARPFPALACAAVVTLVALEAFLIRVNLSVATFVNFVLPTAALGGALVWQSGSVGDDWGAVRRTVIGWTLVTAGVFAALAPFLAWYASAGALADLYRGVFVLPQLRLDYANEQVPGIGMTWSILAVTALLVTSERIPQVVQWTIGLVIVVAGAVTVTGMSQSVYIGIMASLLLIVPLVVCTGSGMVVTESPDGAAGRPVMLAIFWTIALHHLIRYPFDGPVYFTYVAPLAALAAGGVIAAIHERWPGSHPAGLQRRPVLLAVGIFYAGFLVMGPNKGGFYGPRPDFVKGPLPIERAGIDVPIQEALEYGRMAEIVRELSQSDYIYAAPDAPEVYFLTGKKNPTRTLFDFFEGDAGVSIITDALVEHDVDLVVVNRAPGFSTLPEELWDVLVVEYPRALEIGRFLILARAVEGS